MKRLLLAAAALSCLVLPAVSAAQDGGDSRAGVGQMRRGVPNPDRGVTNTERQQQFERRQVQPQADASDRALAQQPPRDDRGGVGQIRRGVPNPDRGVTNTQRQQQFERQQELQRQQDRDRFGRNDRNDRYDNRGGWNRNDPNWWRGRPEFRGYNGPRSGFWFFPNYGYIRPDPRFYGYSWRRGDLVPRTYWQYEVVDPFLYGLDWPPPGYRWVYLGRDIVLMQMGTGRIVEVVTGVF